MVGKDHKKNPNKHCSGASSMAGALFCEMYAERKQSTLRNITSFRD